MEIHLHKESKNDAFNAVIILKCIAAILITNAHIAPFYPEGYQFLSFGGALGNSCFFYCSGFLLYETINKRTFLKWYLHRYLRVMWSVWTFMAITQLLGLSNYHAIEYIQTPYWFINAIIIFYPLFWVILKNHAKMISHYVVGLSILLLIVFFSVEHNRWMIEEELNDVYIHYIFYFAIFLLGAQRNYTQRDVSSLSNLRMVKFYFASIAVFFVYMGCKYNIVRSTHQIYELQIILPLCLTLFAKFMYELCYQLACLYDIHKLRIIRSISRCTLEIYIVQFVLCRLIYQFFPSDFVCLRFVSLLVCIYYSSILLNRFSTYTRNVLTTELISRFRKH